MKDQMDPLYTIFEQHLYNFQDSEQDRKTFIGNILKDYVTYLQKLSIVIPKSLEGAVLEELAEQVTTMLVKKTYGCLTMEDFQSQVSAPIRKGASQRYTKLNSNAKAAKTSRIASRRASG